MAFPMTSVLDNFNRSDEGPPPRTNGTQWTGSDTHFGVVSNVAEPPGSANSDLVANYWDTSTFGPACEACQ